MSFLGQHFEVLAEAPGGIKKLRQMILKLAVMGKLVPQDPNDEPASILLQKIHTEKERLIKAGKIKKQKPLPSITEEEKPYPLPNGWEWVRLLEICENITKGSSPKWQGINYTDKNDGIMFITSENVGNFSLRLQKIKYVEKKFNEIEPRSILKKNDILMNIVGASIGRTAIYNIEEVANINQAVCLIRPVINGKNVSLQYLLQYLNTPFCINLMFDKQVDNARANLSMGNIAKFPIPLPPLSEQRRIVAQVDRLMALCDDLELQQKQREKKRLSLNNASLEALINAGGSDEFSYRFQHIIDHFHLLYDKPGNVAKLKQAILQLAVMGKLVPQDPSDEPASLLLEKIRVEKERLIKEGKIKKTEPLPDISDQEKPYSLPKGWEWVRFPELGIFRRGKSKHRPRNDVILYSSGKYPMVQTGDVARSNGIIKTHTALYNDVGLKQSHMWPKGTMCITIAANIADSGILDYNACFPDSIVGFVPSTYIGSSKYYEYFIRTAKRHLNDFAPSTAQKNINLGILEQILIPQPPLSEQRRIVAQVDRLLALCDELETLLNSSATQREKLFNAVLNH
jgi:type I restriction enzyme S subunit